MVKFMNDETSDKNLNSDWPSAVRHYGEYHLKLPERIFSELVGQPSELISQGQAEGIG